MSGITNQEIAAGLARQEAWNCVFIAVTLKMHELRTANGSALEAIGSPEWRRLDAQQTAVWEASAGDATPEEMEQAKAAVREHAPELCDVLGIEDEAQAAIDDDAERLARHGAVRVPTPQVVRDWVKAGMPEPPFSSIAPPTVVCLCGSTRFGEAFRAANLRETLAGKIVLSIGCDMRSDTDIFGGMSESKRDQIKRDLDELHKRKIDIASEILVLDIGGYIGDSTRSEILYAIEHGKIVRYLSAESPELAALPPESTAAEPRPAAALHEAALAVRAPMPNEPYFLHIVSDPGPHQPLAVLLAEHETSGINASGFLDLADVEEIYPMRNGQAQVVVNGTDLILSAASATQVCNELDVNVGERFAWRLAAADAKAEVAAELFASANAAMQHLAGLCDCEAGSGCDRARIREQLRAALTTARAAGIGSDNKEEEASP